MFWLILVLMVLVVGAAALAALGAGGSLPDAERDRLAAGLPKDRPVAHDDIDELRFPMALRGYRMDEVDDTLDRLAAELSQRDHRVAELEHALSAALAPARGEGTGEGTGTAAGTEGYQPTIQLGKVEIPDESSTQSSAAGGAGTEKPEDANESDEPEDEQR
ncbi:DivIVA domain-containing protein [Streptacidiphilus fuscans]|uniref:DivIVA domain-containing protein n=1 Tax=Streptacidiphilus fuscans TaxID=2789292 RepID=A0A931AY32_9ACTN|nr:DivIVA domain-containing protein [Streptacidiphilus fuscans]MBF9067645.1 DivIVA domain-containing protein [Streptacidiphilus fuscans]